MAQYTAVTGDPTGPVCTGVAVSSSDQISGNDIANGAVLIVTAGGTPTTFTFTDPGHTPAGTAAGSVSGVTVAANTSRAFGKLANYVNSATNTATVNYSSTTSVTAMLVV